MTIYQYIMNIIKQLFFNIIDKQNTISTSIDNRKKLFLYVQSLSYQINWLTKSEQVIEAGAGYCVSKHRLLKELLCEMWIESNLCFVPFCFGDVSLPKHLQGRGMALKKWYHVFLQCNINGNLIFLDASFGMAFSKIYQTSILRDWVHSMIPFWWPYNEITICKNKDDEKHAKEKFTKNTTLDTEDKKRIEEFNKRSFSISSNT